MATEKTFGKGAVVQERDEMVASFSEIVADSPTFDWVRGFDIREKLGRDLSDKDQNGSGSCGGQAGAYLTEAILDSAEASARSIYNKCFYPNGGGSTESGLMSTLINIGVDKEADTTSYENGNPPSEDFMRTPDSNPSFIRGLRPVYVNTDFDSMATAALQNRGIIIGIAGQDNGTWHSAEPKPPVKSAWNHWVYVGFAGLRNGRKCLGFKNSWGKTVGENGWQYIYEDYEPFIWRAWSMVYNNKARPTYKFTKQLAFGQSSGDIKALQDVLRFEGVFNNVSTGYYGPLTAAGVLAFQKKHKVSSVQNLNSLQGKNVGPLTLKKLNELYN